MLLRTDEGYKPTPIKIWLNSGGLGDQICRLPALIYMAKHYPQVEQHIYAPGYYPALASSFLPKAKFYPKEAIKDAPEEWSAYWFEVGGYPSPLGMHLVDLAFNILVQKDDVSLEDKSYPRLPWAPHQGIGQHYICLTPGFTSETRRLPAKTWNEIARGCLLRGYKPVWLGSTQEKGINASAALDGEIDYGVGLDLTNRTSLLEAAAIMDGSSAVIGLDNGLIHLAGMTGAKIVAGYSSQIPRLRMPIRDGVLGKDVFTVLPDGCQGCEAKVRYNFNHDFRVCYFGDYECTKSLTSMKFLAALDRALAS